MSILLDALKKSETQRRLGSAPTLESPEFNSQHSPPRDHSWIPIGLSLAAAGVILWFGLKQFGLPEGNTGQDLTATTEQAVVVEPETPANEEPPPAANPSVRPGKIVSRNHRNSAKSQTATTPLKEYRESPSRNRSSNTHRVAQAGAIQPRQSADLPVKTFSKKDSEAAATSSPGNGSAGQSARSTENPNEELERQVREAGPTAGGDSAEVAANPASASGELEPYLAEPISYWQLPQSLRDSLGELRVSVLVYSENPQDRFLLVNGQRLREQEELDEGLLLLEIQRDRAIFSYRNYRFQLKS